MFRHTTSIRVRYAETDKMNYVYYGNYATYYEVGRVEAMRSLGVTYATMEDDLHVMMPVMNASFEYLRPAFYDDLLRIETTIPILPEREIVFVSEIFNAQGKLLNKGVVRLCFIDTQTKKRIETPRILLEKLNEHYVK